MKYIVTIQKTEKNGSITKMAGVLDIDTIIEMGAKWDLVEATNYDPTRVQNWLAPVMFDLEKAMNKGSEYRVHILES